MTTLIALKALHVLSIVSWLAAMATTGAFLTWGRGQTDASAREAIANWTRGIYLKFQAPALALALITGISQMMLLMQDIPGWMKSNIWLHYKLMAVIGLAVLDHVIMRRILVMKRKPGEEPKAVKIHLALIAVFALTTIALAVIQPVR